MDFVDGEATIELRHGETKVASGLPNGTTFFVLEDKASAKGYNAVGIGDSGIIVGDSLLECEFVNIRNIDSSPNTGDAGHLNFWTAMFVSSLMGLVAIFSIEKRRYC